MQLTKFLIPALAAVWLIALSACSVSEVEFDKAALSKVHKVAIVLYTVPLTIEVRDNPREKDEKKSTLQALAELAQSAGMAANGQKAATLAHQSFIETFNQQGLPFKAITQREMMGNSRFMSLAAKHLNEVLAAQAKAEAKRKKDEGMMGKALGFLGSLGGGGGGGTETAIGAAPEGLPSFGLVGDWFGAKSALLGIKQESTYISEAIKALNVDAAIVINDPGFSWGCETCIGNTGNASTQSAFLITIVNGERKSILTMRQWFSIGGGNAAMISGVINPLQYDNLYNGHGEKTARVFADYYKEEGGK